MHSPGSGLDSPTSSSRKSWSSGSVFLSAMSAWYEETPEGPSPPLAPQMMDIPSDYGVITYPKEMPSQWPDGKQRAKYVLTRYVPGSLKTRCMSFLTLGVNKDYSQMEFVVEDTDEEGAFWNPYRESPPARLPS